MALRILYFGLPIGALCLEAREHAPLAACIGHRSAPGWRRLRGRWSAARLLLAEPDLNDPHLQALLASLRPQAILSFFYPRAIPAAVLELAPAGAFGTHPSLLPALRGPDPYFWAILEGHPVTGVSLHRLTADYDAGPVIAQREVAIAAEDTSWSLAKKLDRPALELLIECADQLAAGESLPGLAQDPQRVSQAPQPNAQQLSIDWKRSSASIERLVRAAAPYPGATALIGQRWIAVVRVQATEAFPRALRPGEAWLHHDRLIVRTGSGALQLEAGRDLDTDRWLDAAALAAQLDPKSP